MKYIRTKKGIFKVIYEDNYIISVKNSYCIGSLWKADYKDKIQIADTIEELCDEFVGVVDGCIPYIWRFDNIDKYRERNTFIKSIIENKSDDEIIYGAIRTDKGLKYVAILNDKGELELL